MATIFPEATAILLTDTLVRGNTLDLELSPEYDTFQHIIAVGNNGSDLGYFTYPEGISVQESTGLIYVSDPFNHRVQILSETGQLFNQFGDRHLEDPHGIAVQENSVYVTDTFHHAIFLFALPEFAMIERVGKEGSGKEEFKSPRQLTLSPNRHLYVADCYNDRLQILNYNLVFQKSLRHQTMTRPVDVKFSTKQMLVLSRSDNPFIHMFTFSGEKICSIITRGAGMQVRESYFFCLDGKDNIIISDWSDNIIKIFSPEGNLIYVLRHPKFHFYYPKGIAILKLTKLVCVSHNDNFPLQVFSA